jgi:hypothetical protein
MAGRKNAKKSEAAARRYVDMWAFPGVHPTNLEILQRLKMADDLQFGANMDVCGTVSEWDPVAQQWARTCLLALRMDAWNPNREQQQKRLEAIQRDRQDFHRRQIKQSGPLSAQQTERMHRQLLADPVMRLQPVDFESRRMVLKLFRSSENIRWLGSLEEVTTAETHNSLAARKPLLSLTTTLEGHKFLTEIQENHRTFRIPSIFSFCYFHQQKERMWYVNLRRKWISFGVDYVIEAEGQRIGEIDGALFGFGYNAHISVEEPLLAKDKNFLDLLTLFTGSVSYHNASRRAVRRRMKASRRGLAGDQIIEAEEFRLLKNPRAA